MDNLLKHTCPICKEYFTLPEGFDSNLRKMGLTTIIIKPHKNCDDFLLMVDPKGMVRGSQIIHQYLNNVSIAEDGQIAPDSAVDPSLAKIIERMEEKADFYRFQKLTHAGKRAIRSSTTTISKDPKYQKLLRTSLLKTWISQFLDDGEEFRYLYLNDIYICTINLYNDLILTVGFVMKFLDPNLSFNSPDDFLQYLKQKTIAIAEKVFSAQ